MLKFVQNASKNIYDKLRSDLEVYIKPSLNNLENLVSWEKFHVTFTIPLETEEGKRPLRNF